MDVMNGVICKFVSTIIKVWMARGYYVSDISTFN